ncbi:MAG: DUF4271 domain-containing protein [Aureispira sp.]
MTVLPNLTFYHKIWSLLLLGCLLWAPVAVAQDSLSPSPKPKPVLPSVRTATAPKVVPSTDIAKATSTSYFTNSFKVLQSKLPRKYYNNNIFDIDESDNPFALTGGNKNRQNTAKEQRKKEGTAVFSQLFASKSNNGQQSTQWLIFFLLGILSFMAMLLAIYPKDVRLTFQAFLSSSANKNVQREQAGFLKIESFTSYLLFVSSMGTFLFLTVDILQPDNPFNSFGMLLLFILGVACVYILKHFQLKVLSFILPCHQEIETYNFIIFNTNKALGFLLIPLLFLVAYVPSGAQYTAFYASVILLGLIYMYRTLKGLAAAASLILFRKFHFIVYLCAVEIAPMLILLKLLYVL